MSYQIQRSAVLVTSKSVVIVSLETKIRRLSSSIIFEECSRIFVLAVRGGFHRQQLHLLESRFFQHASELKSLILGLFLLLFLSALVEDFDEFSMLGYEVFEFHSN